MRAPPPAHPADVARAALSLARLSFGLAAVAFATAGTVASVCFLHVGPAAGAASALGVVVYWARVLGLL